MNWGVEMSVALAIGRAMRVQSGGRTADHIADLEELGAA